MSSLCPKDQKKELVANGFRQHQLRDASGSEIFKDAWYIKSIEDTTITYFFMPEYLESVSIDFKTNMKNFETIARYFASRGFTVTKPKNPKAKLALIEPILNYHYDVYLLERKNLVTLEHYFREPDFKGMPPPPDSVEVKHDSLKR